MTDLIALCVTFRYSNLEPGIVQVPSLSPSQKSKYTILNPEPPANGLGGGGGREVDGRAGSANNVPTTKLDQVPEPKMILFRREQVQWENMF